MIRKLTIDDFEKVEPTMAALHKIHVENRSDFILKMRIRSLKRNARRCKRQEQNCPDIC